MRGWKSLLLFLGAYIVLSPASSFVCGAQQGEVVIPPEAHEKAVQALKALGPDRGAIKIESRAIAILGIVKGLESKVEQLEAALEDLGADETETGYQIELSGDILFEFDKWDIRPEAEEILIKVGEVIEAAESPKVSIAGHTDSKGSDDYNQTLSEKRAEAVKSWLVQKAGVSHDVIETVGFGETKPVAPNSNPDGSDNPEGRRRNRRVEIVVNKQ
jgi:outer membrane protein OmpA-like peptidoglycan-associated protein